MPLKEALSVACERDADLIELLPEMLGLPAFCRIMNFEKFKREVKQFRADPEKVKGIMQQAKADKAKLQGLVKILLPEKPKGRWTDLKSDR